MSNTDSGAPRVQGLDLFEHYEANGNLLVVTSDWSTSSVEPGDTIYRRPWATAAPAQMHARAEPPVTLPADDIEMPPT